MISLNYNTMTSLCVYVTSAYGYILIKRIHAGNIVFSLSVVKFSVQHISENLFDFAQGKCFLF